MWSPALLFWILATRHITSAYAVIVWVHNITVIRANLLHVSVPWENAPVDFLVADTQTLDKSSWPLCDQPDSFFTDSQCEISLHFRYMRDSGDKNLRGYLTTLLAAWNVRWRWKFPTARNCCWNNYVSSYVTKMHEAATSEVCTLVTSPNTRLPILSSE